MTGAVGGLLVSPGQLARELASPLPPVLLDVRWRPGGPPGHEIYSAGHIPGAVYVDLDTDLAGPPGSGGRHPLPGPGRLQAAMRRAGVTASGQVVAYDDSDGTIAARAWWTLRYFGHDLVRVLDGGFRGWVGAGQPAVTEVPRPAPGDFTAVPGQMPVLDAAGAAALALSGILLDARQAERYRGEVEPLDPVAGHIPGAVSAPTRDNVGSGGRFLAVAQLRRRFAGLGVEAAGLGVETAGLGVEAAGLGVEAAAGPAVGVYCGSGVTAAHEVLALRIAGIPAALFVGSWSDWTADPARPVATGASPG